MKSKRIFFFLIAITILSGILVACSKGTAVSEPVGNQGETQESLPPDLETIVPTKAPLSIPEDVPIISNAYDLKVPDEFTIYYKVDLPLQDVVKFYNDELPNYGWDEPKYPDSAVGAMAQMARSKQDKDRITFSMQYNPVGEFTVVQISLTRAP